MVAALFLIVPAAAHASSVAGAAPRMVDVSLPAMPLNEALQRYSELTGRSVLHDAGQVAGRYSAPVQGRYTPEEALLRLLAGSGIVTRHSSTHAVSLAPRRDGTTVGPPAAQGAQANLQRQRFYGRVQARIRQALCANPAIEVGSYRLALRFRINDLLALDAVQVHASGRPELEPVIRKTLSGLALGAAPPRGFAQPATMLITPEAVRRYGGCRP